MRIWLPTFIFLLAITAPILVAAYVLFGFQFAGASFQYGGTSNGVIALYVVCGVMASFVLATIVTSIVLRFKPRKTVVPETAPVPTTVLKRSREQQDRGADYQAH